MDEQFSQPISISGNQTAMLMLMLKCCLAADAYAEMLLEENIVHSLKSTAK
jgi:hypothetical protein